MSGEEVRERTMDLKDVHTHILSLVRGKWIEAEGNGNILEEGARLKRSEWSADNGDMQKLSTLYQCNGLALESYRAFDIKASISRGETTTCCRVSNAIKGMVRQMQTMAVSTKLGSTLTHDCCRTPDVRCHGSLMSGSFLFLLNESHNR